MIPPAIQRSIDRLDALVAEYDALPILEKEQPIPSSMMWGNKSGDHTRYAKYLIRESSAVLDIRMRQAIRDIAPNTAYADQLKPSSGGATLKSVCAAISADYKAGHYGNQHELAHAEVFADQLDEAQELYDSGYLVAAAVTAGSAGEAHLKRLAIKNGVDVEKADGSAIKSSKINEDLAKKPVYDATTAKYVVAWQGTRNDAAHGAGEKVTPSRVTDLIGGLRGFMRDYPA